MRLTIEPIAPHFREGLNNLLGPFGLPPAVVEWKYFARPSDAAGAKGFVWLRHGAVRGCIGLIPFTLFTPAGQRDAAWTCDWIVDSPQSNPGIGVMLLHHAKRAVDPLFSLGGNQVTKTLVTRIAAHVYSDAMVDFYLPLRIGGSRLFRAADRRANGMLRAFQHVPLRSVGAAPGVVESGVSSTLEPLLGDGAVARWRPAYDLTALKWQLEECPVVESVTCHMGSADTLAAALCWRQKSDGREWRMALRSRSDQDEQTKRVVRRAVSYMLGCGAHRVMISASSTDAGRIRFLRDLGFIRQAEARPMFVTTAGSPVEQLSDLSLLDGDLSYRF